MLQNVTDTENPTNLVPAVVCVPIGLNRDAPWEGIGKQGRGARMRLMPSGVFQAGVFSPSKPPVTHTPPVIKMNAIPPSR